jgi:hypothetical protein
MEVLIHTHEKDAENILRTCMQVADVRTPYYYEKYVSSRFISITCKTLYYLENLIARGYAQEKISDLTPGMFFLRRKVFEKTGNSFEELLTHIIAEELSCPMMLVSATFSLPEKCKETEKFRSLLLSGLSAFNHFGKDLIEMTEGNTIEKVSLDKICLQNKYSSVIPNGAAIDKLCEYSPILEVFGGSGFWINLCFQAGADVISTDLVPFARKKRWHVVQKKNASHAVKAIKKTERSLFMCAPPKCNAAYQALELFTGDAFIYAGDSTTMASPEFFDLLKDEWVLTETIELPNFSKEDNKMQTYWRKNGSGPTDF